MDKTVIIHGHFYQPPRRNPWTGMLERQGSACPADNWNERIFNECYLPNTGAVITNPDGEEEVVNNFELISFNIGPTLSSWMAENYIDTYRKIIKADENTHNAVALSYNHTILPLDSEIVRRAQIEWGIRDFQGNYNRLPKAMWLPECAVSYEVVDELIKAGMSYLFLTPDQAESIKRIRGTHWYDVSDGSIDVRRPYRLFTNNGYLDVFFSHRELAVDISFRKLLANPSEYANRIEKAFGHKYTEDLILTIVTDGETFGHHHHGMEKGLAYLLKYELPARGIRVTNPAHYLRSHAVDWEVRIKDNSSWSCAHGIRRWIDDCGCGAEEGSDLKWRKPLRESITWLGDRIIHIFNEKAGEYFDCSHWEAVNGFGEALSNCSRLKNFHDKYVKPEHRNSYHVNKIMEIIHYAFYMFTSCGWFFGKLKRLEPVQNLSVALRAIEMVKEVWGVDLEGEFYSRLNQHPDVEYVWNSLVKPRRVENETLIRDCLDIYKYTGIDRKQFGYWFVESYIDGDDPKVRMRNCRTGEVLEH